MKQFLKFFVAFTLSILLLVILVCIGLFIYLKSTNSSPTFKKEEILVLHFPDVLKEHVKHGKFDQILNKNKALSLFEITKTIENAAKDKRIKGILINGKSNISINQISSLHQALKKFKNTGKFIESYGEYYSQNAYVLSSIADRIAVNPNGRIYYKGYGFVNFYLKDFFKKYHIKPQFFVAGKYKSFIEMFSRNESSPENDIQYTELLLGLNHHVDSLLSSHRNISLQEAKFFREHFIGNDIQQSRNMGLLDTIMYKSDYLKFLSKKIDSNVDDAFIGINKYYDIIQSELKNTNTKPEVAIVFAEGDITSEKGDDKIDEARYRETFNTIRKNKNIKAIVLRINSPGGTSNASDELWHELELCKKDSIPVYVSMADYAASGGYYIASAAQKIYAEATTVTGSIGVFSMMFELEDALEENFDIHIDHIRTSPFSLGLNALSKMTPEQKMMMQDNTDNLYKTFKNRVAKGRNMGMDKVEEIAQGRVYLGEKARALKLIDSIGTLSDVLQDIHKTFDISNKDYEIYPKNNSDIQEEIAEVFQNSNPFSVKAKKVLGRSMSNFLNLEKHNGTFMRMPYFEIR